jgi:hypothetical protein
MASGGVSVDRPCELVFMKHSHLGHHEVVETVHLRHREAVKAVHFCHRGLVELFHLAADRREFRTDLPAELQNLRFQGGDAIGKLFEAQRTTVTSSSKRAQGN